MEGFKTFGCQLARRIDQDFPDLHLWDDVAVIGADGSVAWEGRLSQIPRSMADTHSIAVNGTGWVAHMKDRKLREIYLDWDVSAWGDMPLNEKARCAAVAASFGDFSWAAERGGLVCALPNQALGARTLAEVWYVAPAGVRIAGAFYRGKRTGWPAGWTSPVIGFWETDQVAVPGETVVATLDDTMRQLVPAGGPRPYVEISTFSNGTASTPTAGANETWSRVGLYGTHGLPFIGTDPAIGLAASDMLKDVISRFCPKLSTAGIQPTTYPIQQAKFADSTYPYDAMLFFNGYHLWNFAVWEKKTAYYSPFDLSDYDWEIRLSDPGVKVDLQGDSTESLANGIEVTYIDALTGVSARLTPDDTSELADTTVENEANRHGLKVWTSIDIASPVFQDDAIQIGVVALAEYNQPKAPGTITATGHIRDRAGHWQQGWKVRGGDRVAITDHPNSRPRLITEAGWDHDTKTLTIATDSTLKRVDAVLDRFATALAAGGLTA